jgi:tetratricopeptide (TPR) repeat protein
MTFTGIIWGYNILMLIFGILSLFAYIIYEFWARSARTQSRGDPVSLKGLKAAVFFAVIAMPGSLFIGGILMLIGYLAARPTLKKIQFSQRINKEIAEFNKLFKAENYKAALRVINRLLKKLEPTDQLWKFKTRTLIELKRFEEALEAAEHAIALNSQDSMLWNLKSLNLYALDRFEEALEAAEKASALNPNDFLAWAFKAQALEKLGSPEYLRATDISLKLNPDLDTNTVAAGIIFQFIQDLVSQIPRLEVPTETSSRQHKPLLLRPETLDEMDETESEAIRSTLEYLREQNYSGAQAAALVATTKDSKNDLSWLLLSVTSIHLKDFDNAREASREALHLNANRADTWYLLGLAHVGEEEYLSAANAFMNALKLDFEFTDAMDELAKLGQKNAILAVTLLKSPQMAG